MTIKIPGPSFSNKILKALGEKRAVFLPTKENYGKHGQYLYAIGIKENFWKALVRTKNRKLPEGTVDIFSLNDLHD